MLLILIINNMARQSRETLQKKVLKREIQRFNRFFTAEELHARVKNIGIATVYRFLKEAEQNHELHSYLCDRKMVYSRSKDDHCAFVCQRCNKRTHFDISSVDFFKKKVPGSLCHFQLEVHGLCDSCLKK
jgi:Fe2+ or Zn2+ uptake regulation protein